MRILKIELCNLASLAGEHTIDFTETPLSNAHLYAITGDTGTGKSTILDAICLALYGQTPRLNEAKIYDDKQAKVTHIMRRGSNECYARVTFATGDKRYRSSWKLRRKRTGTFDTPHQLIEQLLPTPAVLHDKQGYTPNSVIVELTGLTYEQFTRTVLLAQNSFATFLKADTKDKAQLLEKITGTEIYKALSTEVHNRLQQANTAVTSHKAKMEGVSQGKYLEPVVAKEQQTLLTKLRTQIAAKDEQQQHVAKLLQWYTDHEAIQKAMEQANHAYSQAVAQRNLRATEATRLERYDSVQHLRDIFRIAQQSKVSVNTTRQQLTALQTQIATLSAEHKVATDAKAKAEADLYNASEQLKQRMPSILQGLQLQASIEQIEKTLREDTQEQDVLRKASEKNTLTLKARMADVEKLQDTLDKISLYFTQNNRHERMVKHYGRIESQLEQLHKLNTEINRYKAQSGVLVKREGDLAKAEKQATELYNTHLQRYTEAEANLQLLQQRITGQNADLLHDQLHALSRQVELLEQLIPLWDNLVRANKAYDDYTLDLSRTSTEIEQLTKALPIQQKRVEQRQKEADASRERYHLSENIRVEEMRAQLQNGMPCPVCGSGHHPWHTEQAQEKQRLKILTEDLRIAMEEAARELATEQQQLQALSNDLSAKEANFKVTTRASEDTRISLEKYHQEWQNKASQVQGLEVNVQVSNDREVRLRLQQLYERQSVDAKQASDQMANYNAVQQAIAKQQALLEKLRQEGRTLDDELKTAKQQLKDNRNEQENNTTLLQRASDEAARLTIDIGEVVSLDDWQTNIEASATEFKRIHNDWRTKEKQQTAYKEQLATARQEQTAAQTTSESYAERLEQLAQKIEDYKKQCHNLQQQLTTDFPERKPAQEQEFLTAQEAQCHAKYEDSTKAYNKITLDLEKAEGQRTTTEQTLERYEKEHTEAETRLLRGTTDYNAHHAMLQEGELQSLFDDTTDWQALRSAINALNKQCDDAKRVCDERNQQLNTLLTATDRPEGDEETQESLALRHTAIQQEAETLKTQADEITFRLRQHEAAVAELATLQDQLETLIEDAGHWRTLDDLIGGHQGTKFSQRVQAYSFQFLLESANRQLAQISRRYHLCSSTESPLAFYVEDLDLGGEKRPSASLSGGETFIVSLALALALADLSTGTTRIESLFIDEGFGTLDNASLAQVMQTLDRLHSTQNRQVGIISHAEAIKQSVRPSIAVQRVAAGTSTINITL